ncbi:MAG TPA: adenosine deaminase [Methylomirabilota bacterium]|nr:adenosine deaminase [Methylomirabilota bacterium]
MRLPLNLQALPKAELHVHLEGSIEPAIASQLASRYGAAISEREVTERYAPGDFARFLDAFKWVTSFLRGPGDYALVARQLAESLVRQNVLYAEVTLSAGVMLRREQDPLVNFAAVREAASQVPGIRINWIFDAVRQFGPQAAMEVARLASSARYDGVVAFGMGGDELALPAEDFRRVYEFAAAEGLHRLVHAGEMGGPEQVCDAVDLLGAERIGHGIAVMRSERTMDYLAARGVTLEVCPTSNLRTGALARQLEKAGARPSEHPLELFLRRGLRVTLGSDDPAMFETTLTAEYELARSMGLREPELVALAEAGFSAAFLSEEDRAGLLRSFQQRRALAETQDLV